MENSVAGRSEKAPYVNIKIVNMPDKKIIVVGSSNTDMVIKTTKLPLPGETILGGDFLMNPGGKGANQAVAAARLGGKVSFIGKTGSDIFGEQARITLKSENINTNFIVTDQNNPSGVALITVDDKGENCIVVASGSNAFLSKTDIDNAKEEILSSDIILMQLEIPLDTVNYVAEICSGAGKTVILNPAPATYLPDELLRRISIITPNETEAELLTGMKITDPESAKNAAHILLGKGIGVVILTLGSKGALICTGKKEQLIPTAKVKAVDTTAAGDVFNGAIAVAISENFSIEEAVQFANKAAAISVTRMGAQSSVPYRNEIS
jgi:ribokinase